MKIETYKKKLDENGNPIMIDGDYAVELVNSEELSEPTRTLDEYKKHLIDLQDKKTEDLILSGFTFGNNLFSLSVNAQVNWNNLLNIPQAMFPLNLSTKDDKIYVLNFTDVQNFYFTSLGRKNECLQTGNLIKKRINECETTEELDLIKLEIWE